MTPRALVFDAYGTLFDVHSVLERCESFWPANGARVSQLWRAKQLEWTWQRSLMGRYAPFSQITQEALHYTCEALGLAIDGTRVDALMQEYRRLAPYPDAPSALERLRAPGRRLAILTNGSPDMIEPLVAHSGLAFDAVLSVDEQKTFKPVPRVYEIATRRLELPAEAIGFVSSNCWDALGARSFGFRSWWINRTGAPVDSLGAQPDGILKSLADLPAIVGA